MADDRITIFFEPKGDKQLVKAINTLARAQGRLAGASKKVARGNMRQSASAKKATKSFNALGGTMSVVRSRLLVYGFAMTLVNKTVGATIRGAMQQEDAEKKLAVQLGFTSTKLQEYASELQKVTRFGDEETLAVMGQISAFTKNEEQIASLTQATLDLSEGMGIGLQEAGLLVGKTFGSSTDALSRYGIKTKGVAGSQERMESLTKAVALKYGGLSENIDTTSKALTQMGNALGDAGEEIGEAFLPITKKLAVGMTKFTHETLIPMIEIAKRIDLSETIKNIANNFQVVIDLITVNFSLMTKLLVVVGRMALDKLIGILPEVAGIVSEIFTNVGEILKATLEVFSMKTIQFFIRLIEEPKKMWRNFVNFIIRQMNKMIDAINPVAKKFGKEFEKIAETPAEAFKKHPIDEQVEKAMEKLQNTQMFQTIAGAWEGSGDDLNSILEAMGENFQESFSKLLVLNPAESGGEGGSGDPMKKILGMSADQLDAMMNKWGEYNTAIMGVADSMNNLKLKGIENQRQEALSATESIRNERRKQKEVDKINKKYDAKIKKQKQEYQKVKIAEAISNTALAITKYHSEGKLGLAILAGIQGAVSIATIKAEKYQYGGVVGGNRHSQGGTMIEAERGEFVVSRNGVNSVGLETLNRINSGQGAGGLQIAFNGNVLSKDFIEDEAIPMIKNAIRRGEDLGIS